MKQSIRFLHSADLHLDSPYAGMQGLPESILNDVKESTLIAFNRLIDLAINEQVDFVLFVGDLFDQQSTSIKSVLTLKKGLQKLADHHIKAYLSFGNHDYGIGEKIDLTFPDNTYVFHTEDVTALPFEKNGEVAAYVYGFSYERQKLKKKKVKEYELIHPEAFQIATLHGSLQSNTEHDTYAPFRLEELKNIPADYWALGHIHTREVLSKDPYIVYPGNIQGRHINEAGERGCYIVDLDRNDTQIKFHPLQTIQFEEKSIQDVEIEGVDQLEEVLSKAKDDWRVPDQKYIIRLHLALKGDQHASLTDPNALNELIELINEEEETEKDWVWIQDIKLHYEVQYDREALKDSNQFIGEVLHLIDTDTDTEDYLDMLRNKTLVKKHVDPFTEETLQEIKKEAEQLIVQALVKEGEDR